MNIVLRVNPGVETHEFIQTGQEDSKFGLSIKHGLALEAINKVKASKHLQLKGVHFHVGSQIEGTEAMIETAKLVLHWLSENEIKVELLVAVSVSNMLKVMKVSLLKKVLQKLLMQLKKLLIHLIMKCLKLV